MSTSGLPSVRREAVLIAEADELAARVLRAKLTAWGYEAILAANADEAVHRFATESIRIAIIGFRPPDWGGADLCRRMRALPRAAGAYLIGLGAANMKEALITALDSGCDDYFQKPISTSELRLRLENARRVVAQSEPQEVSSQDAFLDDDVVDQRTLVAFLRVMLARAARTGIGGTLMFLRFRELAMVRDRLGPAAAAEVVRQAQMLVNNGRRRSDVLASLGDELCLLLPDTPWESCEPVVRRMVTLFSGWSVSVDGRTVEPSVSVEAVTYPEADRQAEAYLQVSRIACATINPATSIAERPVGAVI